MAGLFGVLDVAQRGLAVTQQGIRVSGHNIANVGTPGYSRQRQILETTPPVADPSGNLGTGVEQRSIERITDDFIQSQLLDQGSRAASTDAQARALSLVEQVLNEQQGEGVATALSRLYDAFSDLASTPAPGAPAEREAVRSSAEALIQTLHGLDAQLRDLQAANNDRVKGLLPEINSIAARIVDLNVAIADLETQAPANDLRDERDRLVRELATRIDVRTFEQTNGSLVVTVPSGIPLVEGSRLRELDSTSDPGNPFGPNIVRIEHVESGYRIDLTDEIGSGELGGLLRARDTLIPSAIRSLDSLAYNLARQVNAVHSAGTGLDGSVGDFFAALPGVEDAARDLALDAGIAANTDRIAAGLTTAPGDNRNALALAALRDTPAALYLPGDPPGPATGPGRTLLEHAGAIVAEVGQQARTLGQAGDQQARVLADLENRRDAVSGVSLDEEMAQLIQLEAAFQANARVMNSVSRMLEDLMSVL
ncbi:MAG: flagellar hook-associated protein FlgK [Myxococcales bacterium]|nr:flagellar hook-associated protein FlgK [Myxococcales bacterium]